MNHKIRAVTLALILALTPIVTIAAAQVKGSGSVRAAVQSFFALLKAGKYDSLYEYLPAEMQQRMTREQLSQRLRQLEDFLIIERLEIGRIQQRQLEGNEFAVVDTTLYGRLRRPLQMNGQTLETGKVIVQQYLFREGTQWKIATADGRVRSQFLKRYPSFSKNFQLRTPQFYFKQNGVWKAFQR